MEVGGAVAAANGSMMNTKEPVAALAGSQDSLKHVLQKEVLQRNMSPGIRK